MPSEGGNPFTKLDARSVVGMFKATGTLAMICIGVGAFMTITVFLAIAGIPSILFGVWMWRFAIKNVAAVEAGYTEYAATLSA